MSVVGAEDWLDGTQPGRDVLVKRSVKLKSHNLFLSLIFQRNGGEGPPVYYNIKLAETRNK